MNIENQENHLGSLHGLPIAVKDIIGTLEMPTECGTLTKKKNARLTRFRSC